MRLILLLLMYGVNLSAAEITWVNAFPFYVYGDVSYISTVYEFVKAIATDDSVQVILGLGFSIQFLIAGYQARLGGIVDIAKSAIAPITLYALFVVPTVNVHITDLRVDKGLINHSTPDGGYKKVDDIPYAIAAIPASASMLVSVFIDIIDDNWNSVNLGARFSTLGFQGISRISKEAMIVAKLEDINSSAVGNTAYNLNQYLKHCMIIKGFKLSKGNKHLLTHPSKPFPDMFDPSIYAGGLANARVTFDDGVDASNTPVDQATCSSLYTTYVSAVSGDIETGMKQLIEQKFPGINADDADLNEAYRDQIGDTANLIGNIGKAMATLSTTRTLERALDTEGIGVNGVSYATESSIQSTLANLRTEGPAKLEWITRVLPDAITIILGILIGAFPLMIIVMSFFGKSASQGIGNYFMGYIAINFNLVSLALVSNIVSYYTAQHAQEAIVSYAGMPFGLTQVNDFMMQQADMAGFAGIIGAVSIFAVTPLIFKGETAGFSAAMSGISGAYRGNVAASAQKELADYDAQQKIDQRALTTDGMSEAEAGAWLSKEGFSKPNSMSAVETYNSMMKNYGQIGSADAASIMHRGNMDKFNAQNYIDGSAAQTMQSSAKTAGLGSSVNEGVVDMAEIESVSVQDGEATGAMIDKTASLRGNSESYDPNDVGAGQAISQFGKDMGSAALSKLDENASATVANATNAVATQVGAGQGLLKTGAFDNDGTLRDGSPELRDMMAGAAMQSAGKFTSLKGMGDSIDGNIESNGFKDYMNGSEFQGRLGANKTIADGEKWESLGSDDNDPDKVALMKKVKENEVAGTFGGIDATNAEIMEHGGVDGAIRDMVTGAKEKGIGSATHADNLRESYGKDLNDSYKGMTLSNTMSEIDQSKIDSLAGNALGVKANKAMGVDYADNAMYGEMSKQQSTQAKLNAQGGVGGAVGIDVTEASIKAGTQKGNVEQSSKILEDAIKSGAAEGAKTLSDAAAKVAEVQTGSQMGTTAGLMKKFSDPEALKKTLEDSGYKEAAKELDGMGAGDMAAWVASKQAGHMTGMHGLALRNDKGEMTSVGVSLGDDGARAMTIDSSFKKDDSKMRVTGDGTNNVSGYNISPTGLLQEAMTTAGMDGHSAEMMSEIVKDGGVVMAADQFLAGGKGRKAAFGAAVSGWHKARGHEKGVNENGKTVWGASEDLMEKGYTKGEDGAWKKTQSSSSGVGPDLKKATATNTTTNATGVNTNANTGVDMKNSSNINSNTIIPKSEQQNKSIAQQIEAQGKYEQQRASIVGQNAKVNALNSGGTPEMLAKQKMELDALDGAHNKNLNISSKPDLSAPSSKGSMIDNIKSFVSSNADSIGKSATNGVILDTLMTDAPKHAIREGNYNAASMYAGISNVSRASGNAVMSVATAAMGAIDAVVPGTPFGATSKAIGLTTNTDLLNSSKSFMSDAGTNLKDAYTNIGDIGSGNHNIAGIYTAPLSQGNLGSMHNPIAPQHAQNAFSTPSGFNTSSAMKTAYNDNTSNINSTPQEYTMNSQDGMSRNLENINMGTEFNQESSEGVRDAVEKLSETIYKNNKE